jgi:polar amino acid transport system permease protein
LPQAIRNVLPALGNDFISMLKDTSLVSVLAVRDITQISKLYAGRTFRYQEAYITLAVLYLTMTVLLSFLMKFIEKRIQKNEQR